MVRCPDRCPLFVQTKFDPLKCPKILWIRFRQIRESPVGEWSAVSDLEDSLHNWQFRRAAGGGRQRTCDGLRTLTYMMADRHADTNSMTKGRQDRTAQKQRGRAVSQSNGSSSQRRNTRRWHNNYFHTVAATTPSPQPKHTGHQVRTKEGPPWILGLPYK